MGIGQEKERHNRKLTTLNKQRGVNQDRSVNTPTGSFMERNFFGQLHFTPPSAESDPAYWPLPEMYDLEYLIHERDRLKDHPDRSLYETAEKYAPMLESIVKIIRAYEILAYPCCRTDTMRDRIWAEIRNDQGWFKRDSVKLDDTEITVLSKIAAARKVPFDPQKRIYEYSKVLNTNPLEIPENLRK